MLNFRPFYYCLFRKLRLNSIQKEHKNKDIPSDSGVFVFFPTRHLGFYDDGAGPKLTVKDFLRVGRYPKAIFFWLFFCQLVILTSIAFFICVVLDLEPLLAVGLMLLAASPGGPTTNLLSFYLKVMWL